MGKGVRNRGAQGSSKSEASSDTGRSKKGEGSRAPSGSLTVSQSAAYRAVPTCPEELATSDDGAELDGRGLRITRRFTEEGRDPLEQVRYDKRRSVIANPDGSIVFEMNDAEVPASWSQLATDIVVSKYFRKTEVPGTGHEVSVKQVVRRLARSIRRAGQRFGGYFASRADAKAFEAELSWLLVNQYGAFNSPAWFNCGLAEEYGIKGRSAGNSQVDLSTGEVVETEDAYSRPQISACFIQKVQDDLMDIAQAVQREMRLFKFGSGTGTNFSAIRAEGEPLSGGGTSSGLMSFLEILDKAAGATKSGGTTRRAAKMCVLDADHPDIVRFIEWKAREEDKARVLIEHGGLPADFNGEAYQTVSGQNSNNSVRLTDQFMKAVEEGGKWTTRFRTTGEDAKTYDARELWNKLAKASWRCADPGIQFDTTINSWHTCPNTDRINASNPCSEYMFLDDSACNLASLNLIKFIKSDGSFDVELFRHAVRIFFIAQEIIVDYASYPTPTIAKNSHDYRPLGLGYANLGTLLMLRGVPYDSDEARSIAAAISGIMCGRAYAVSAEMAASKGPFNGYARNREPMLRVMNRHRQAAHAIAPAASLKDLAGAARDDWDLAVALGEMHGYRNAQATVIAPTGTIGLLMDCDTTGIEPDFALVKWKKLAGGGYFKIVNNSVKGALEHLGYTPEQIAAISDYLTGTLSLKDAPHVNHESLREKGLTDEEIARIEKALPGAFELSHAFNSAVVGAEALERLGLTEKARDPGFSLLKALGFTYAQIDEASDVVCGRMTVEGAPHLRDEHLPVFDCANKCGKIGKRYLAPMAHVTMMAAVQPFISGSISKTVNLPNEASIEEIEQLHMEAWTRGLKCIAIYRDGSKASQPLSTKSSDGAKDGDESDKAEAAKASPEGSEPLGAADAIAAVADAGSPALPTKRRRMPSKRRGFTQEARVGPQKFYIRTGEYEDGTLGEIFIDVAKEGSSYRSLMNCFAIAVSLGLQHGVPLNEFVNMFTFTSFEPQGLTNHPNIKTATSVVDFIFRMLGMEYLGRTDYLHVKPDADDLELRRHKLQAALERQLEADRAERRKQAQSATDGATAVHVAPPAPATATTAAAGAPASASGGTNGGGNGHSHGNGNGGHRKATTAVATELQAAVVALLEETVDAAADTLDEASPAAGRLSVLNEQLQEMMGDAPFCDTCGHITVRNGACYKCLNCGASLGCS